MRTRSSILFGTLRRRILSIDPDEVRCDRRGFQVDGAPLRARIEAIGLAFLDGYHAALEVGEPGDLARRLDALPASERGFAYEGASMALTVMDRLTPGRSRWRRFAQGPGQPHLYMVLAGAGVAMARLPLPIERWARRLDPVLWPLVLDGFGFHEGFFKSVSAAVPVPRRLRGYGRRAFDQGLGRSLWFRCGADPDRVAARIATFPEGRCGDLWSGVGLACSHVGGADAEALGALLQRAGGYRVQLAQGVAFSAEAGRRAGFVPEHTRLACRRLGGLSFEEITALTTVAGEGLADTTAEPAYETWRRRIQEELSRRWSESCPIPEAG